MTVAILVHFLLAAVGYWTGHRFGMKRGALQERRAEAMRRLSAKAETEWHFRQKATSDGSLIYALSPDGHEYTRRFDGSDVQNAQKRKDLGYDDTWYEFDTSDPASSLLQDEITRRFNAWNIAVFTGARSTEK